VLVVTESASITELDSWGSCAKNTQHGFVSYPSKNTKGCHFADFTLGPSQEIEKIKFERIIQLRTGRCNQMQSPQWKRKTPLDGNVQQGSIEVQKNVFAPLKFGGGGGIEPRPQVLRHKVYMLISLF